MFWQTFFLHCLTWVRCTALLALFVMSSALPSLLRVYCLELVVHCQDEQCTAFSFTMHCLKLVVHCRDKQCTAFSFTVHCLEFSSALPSIIRMHCLELVVHYQDEQCTAFSFTVHCLKLVVHWLRMGSALPSLIRMHCLDLVHCLRVVHWLLFYGCTASNCQYNVFMFFARQCKLHTTGSAKKKFVETYQHGISFWRSRRD